MTESVHQRYRGKQNEDGNGHLNGAYAPGKKGSMLRPGLFYRRFPLLVGAVLVLLVLYNLLSDNSNRPSHGVTWWDENFHLPLGFQRKAYVVIIDAGSTGSRVSAFEFHQNVQDKSLKLKAQLFEEIKPGLSSYANNPVEGADKLNVLLNHAKEFIPQELWAETPVSLKATAGLRLLPKDKADAILAAVEDVINKSGFRPTENAVGIMDGVDEGIFSWFTVNFLMDRIGGDVAKTVAALDLGGGSTQITVATSPESVGNYPVDDVVSVKLFHQDVPLYTRSYLGLGLQSVRKAVLALNQTDPANKVLASPCVNPVVSREWVHGGETYTIKGIENGKFEKVKYNGFVRKEPIADYDECRKHIVHVINEKSVIRPKDFNRQVILFSYFFERAAEAGLIDPLEGGKLTVQHYLDAGKQACRTVNADLPLLCLDVTFMGSILHEGYGVAKHTPLLAMKKVHGYEVSWALGLAYHIIQNES